MPFSLVWIMLRGSHSHLAPYPHLPSSKHRSLWSLHRFCGIWHGANLSATNVAERETSRSIQSLANWLMWEALNGASFSSSPHFWDEFVRAWFCTKLCQMPFILPHLFLTIQEGRKSVVKRQPSAVSLKSCTSLHGFRLYSTSYHNF